MNNVLILFAHPRFEQSRSNAALLKDIPQNQHITLRDIYELYPDFNIDVPKEKAILEKHDVIIWHHPFYWYNVPPLLKQWIDMVLEFEWAYGPGGTALKDKIIFNVITSGGPREVYQRTGRNRFTVREFLAPLEQTARICHMTYLPPFTVQGTHRLSDEQLKRDADNYRLLIDRLAKGDFDVEALQQYEFLNDWISETRGAAP